MSDLQVWIGLAHVAPLPGNDELEPGEAAYVTILAAAPDRRELLERLTRSLAQDGYRLLNIEDTEPFERRSARERVDEELIGLANSVARDGETRFGTFHVYPHDEEPN
jgi:hypothetical protein